MEDATFCMYDVGGQKNERKKWIHCFDNVHAVMFVAALSEYDQALFEDETENRMVDAIQLFKWVCSQRCRFECIWRFSSLYIFVFVYVLRHQVVEEACCSSLLPALCF